MVEVRVLRTDLPAKHRKPILEAVELLYTRHVKSAGDKQNKNTRRANFAQALKQSLDESFGFHWHILVGEKIGFACKKRNETMGVWKISDGSDAAVMVVIWQSPGIEEPEPAAGDAGEEPQEAQAAGQASVRVLEPAKVEEGSETASVVASLRSELGRRGDLGTVDSQELAQVLRRRLTTDIGPIWHLAVGHDFVLEAAEDRRNHVALVAGKVRVVCFRHEQFKGGSNVDFGKILASLPYLFLAIFCLGYMTLTSVCKEEPAAAESSFRAGIRQRFCHLDWENYLSYFAGAALVCLFLGRRGRRMMKKDKKEG